MSTPRSTSRIVDIALVAVFAAFIAVAAQFSLPAWVNNVPFSMQPFALFLAGAILGARRGLFAVLLYLLVGTAGLPVFAQGASGLAPWTGSTGGYLVAFPIATFTLGLAVDLAGAKGRALGMVLGGVAAVVITWVLGGAGIALAGHLSLSKGMGFAAPYVPADLVKLAVAIPIALAVHRAFPQLLGRPAAKQEKPATVSYKSIDV